VSFTEHWTEIVTQLARQQDENVSLCVLLHKANISRVDRIKLI